MLCQLMEVVYIDYHAFLQWKLKPDDFLESNKNDLQNKHICPFSPDESHKLKKFESSFYCRECQLWGPIWNLNSAVSNKVASLPDPEKYPLSGWYPPINLQRQWEFYYKFVNSWNLIKKQLKNGEITKKWLNERFSLEPKDMNHLPFTIPEPDFVFKDGLGNPSGIKSNDKIISFHPAGNPIMMEKGTLNRIRKHSVVLVTLDVSEYKISRSSYPIIYMPPNIPEWKIETMLEPVLHQTNKIIFLTKRNSDVRSKWQENTFQLAMRKAELIANHDVEIFVPDLQQNRDPLEPPKENQDAVSLRTLMKNKRPPEVLKEVKKSYSWCRHKTEHIKNKGIENPINKKFWNRISAYRASKSRAIINKIHNRIKIKKQRLKKLVKESGVKGCKGWAKCFIEKFSCEGRSLRKKLIYKLWDQWKEEISDLYYIVEFYKDYFDFPAKWSNDKALDYIQNELASNSEDITDVPKCKYNTRSSKNQFLFKPPGSSYPMSKSVEDIKPDISPYKYIKSFSVSGWNWTSDASVNFFENLPMKDKPSKLLQGMLLSLPYFNNLSFCPIIALNGDGANDIAITLMHLVVGDDYVPLQDQRSLQYNGNSYLLLSDPSIRQATIKQFLEPGAKSSRIPKGDTGFYEVEGGFITTKPAGPKDYLIEFPVNGVVTPLTNYLPRNEFWSDTVRVNAKLADNFSYFSKLMNMLSNKPGVEPRNYMVFTSAFIMNMDSPIEIAMEYDGSNIEEFTKRIKS